MMLRKLILAAALALAPSVALAQSATILPNGESQFVDANGAPYAGGSVCFYAPNTLSALTTWQDPNQTTANTQPCVTLDSAGRALLYGNQQYRQILKDAFGNTIWDQLTNAGTNQITAGTGIAVSPTTGRGNVTVSLAPIAADTGLCNNTGGSAAPTACSLFPTTQNLTSGSSATYTTPAGVVWLKVRMWGAGGGGEGAPNSGSTFVAGSNGGDTIFNGVHAGGGAGGGTTILTAGGAGGTSSTGSATLRVPGFAGGPATTPTTTLNTSSGVGGGPGGAIGVGTLNPGRAAAANSGGGGSGAYNASGTNFNAGSGGGSGEYVEVIITSPASTYTYTIGAGGAGGSSDENGGAGGSGRILVEEHYSGG